MTNREQPPLTGVFPVLPTPFHEDGTPDADGLRTLVRYLLSSGVDGMTYPGVASEVSTLTEDERSTLTAVVLDEVAGRVPVVVGVSSSDAAVTERLARAAVKNGAAALMVAAPPHLGSTAQQADYFKALAVAVPAVPLMLQNVPMPVGAGLEAQAVVDVLEAVPAIAYVKEETLPSGQRLTAIRAGAPSTLTGVFGGAGGRYITDELRRGACGTMPAIELAEVHVALFAAHRQGRLEEVRNIFSRMLPVLNIQSIFRWSLTKYVLLRRSLIGSSHQRMAGPRLDEIDQQDVDLFMDDMSDLLLSEAKTRACIFNQQKVSNGTA
ncbi:MAG TPA: dihydrodipicolinate synthase family protein [Polaromonas sp.]|uniref:dihydrodipicolinate synthase family protein n=1 Tax=Polaromonas sp. TaxID=1869339 RepID=UPI002D5C6358|nr:dihydrodipicolinate synthase family protein [Polaromonas sp.]HYW55564.1 dihydrodipicolinate synthase family protein [Polaromonas sp.]